MKKNLKPSKGDVVSSNISLQNLSLVIVKVLYTFNLDIYTGKQLHYPHQVTNKPADDIKRLVEPMNVTGHNVTADASFTDIIVF